MPFLDDLIGIHDLQVNGGSLLPRRSVLNVIGTGVTAVDNPVTGCTDLTLPTNAGGTTISPAALSSNTNNFSPAGYSTASVIRVSASTAVAITGLNDAVQANVRPVLMNVGSFTITLSHQSASSTTTNRFVCPGSVDYTIDPGETVELVRDTTSNRWRVVS
jgi:hypothetical protein